MLRTKSIIAPPNERDGMRISVMSRHTLQDGTSPDTRITYRSYDLWIPIFSPRLSDVGKYYRNELDWEAYAERYQDYLSTIPEAVDTLARWALLDSVTIMCIEDTPEQCHRRLLAEHCKQRQPSLRTEIQ